jgi:Alkylmercury lyase
MDLDIEVKVAIYAYFADTGRAPLPQDIVLRTGISLEEVVETYARLQSSRVLLLEPDGRTIRMAPPFSGVPTQHRVLANSREYIANCAWDALGIPAALQADAVVLSECGQSGEPLRLEIGISGPGPSDWLFHCLVPAARWWENLVFT